MKIAVAARKGGVGKSSIAAGLAGLLAASGEQVLVVDLDPQSSLAFMLGGDRMTNGTAGVLRSQPVEPIPVADGISAFTGGQELQSVDFMRLDPQDLADELSRYEDRFDHILFDAPPGHDHLERLGVVAADIALAITTADPESIIGAQRVLDDVKRRADRNRAGPSRWALIANKIDRRRSLDKNVTTLTAHIEAPLLQIREDVKVRMASAQGEPLAMYAPKSRALADMKLILEWCRGEA